MPLSSIVVRIVKYLSITHLHSYCRSLITSPEFGQEAVHKNATGTLNLRKKCASKQFIKRNVVNSVIRSEITRMTVWSKGHITSHNSWTAVPRGIFGIPPERLAGLLPGKRHRIRHYTRFRTRCKLTISLFIAAQNCDFTRSRKIFKIDFLGERSGFSVLRMGGDRIGIIVRKWWAFGSRAVCWFIYFKVAVRFCTPQLVDRLVCFDISTNNHFFLNMKAFNIWCQSIFLQIFPTKIFNGTC